MLDCYQYEHLERSHFHPCSEHHCCKLKAKCHYEDEDVLKVVTNFGLVLFVFNNILLSLHHSERFCKAICNFCFVVRYFVSILVLQSSRLGRESWLLCLPSWCLVIVMCLFLTMPRVRLQFVIVVFPDHTHLLFLFNLILSFTNHIQCGSSLSNLLVFHLI